VHCFFLSFLTLFSNTLSLIKREGENEKKERGRRGREEGKGEGGRRGEVRVYESDSMRREYERMR
jgi:hypothetical protein